MIFPPYIQNIRTFECCCCRFRCHCRKKYDEEILDQIKK
ncbi:MAG: hypothetical protein H6Q79_1572, partial [Deltaproteobacteria bacterium]|nr:hypothetical protein [Deltaproteobacteria bacterium]